MRSRLQRIANGMVTTVIACLVFLFILATLWPAFGEPERVTWPFEPEQIVLDGGLAAHSVDRTIQVTIAWDWLKQHPERWPSWMASKDTTGIPGITVPWVLVDWEELRARPRLWPPWMMERPLSRAPTETTSPPKRGIYPSGCIECGHSCNITTNPFGHALTCYPPIYENEEQCEHGHVWVRQQQQGVVTYR